MGNEAVIASGRNVVREHFRWIDGAADTWTMLRSGNSLAAVIDALAELIDSEQPDVVVGVESRGFVLAPAVAVRLGVGFVPMRKDGALFPGPLVEQQTGQDYRGNQRTLATRRDLLSEGQRVVLVDDWIETGSQAIAARQLVAQCGAELVAVAVIVDEASPAARGALPPVRSLVRASEL